MELLISEGADVNAIGQKNRLTPLATARKEGHEEMCQLLLKHGAKTGKELQEEDK